MQIVSIYLVINLIGTLFPFLWGIIDLFHASPTVRRFVSTPAVLFSKAKRVRAPREPNYFDLFRVSLIHRKTLFFFPSHFFYLRFFFISCARTYAHTQCDGGRNLFCFYSAEQRSVVISAVRADVFAIFPREISVQNVYVHTRSDLKVTARAEPGRKMR